MKQNLTNDTAPKSGYLSVALYPDMMHRENGGISKYYARVVNRRKLSVEDIANDVVSDGIAHDKADIVKIWSVMANAILMRLSAGLSVDIGLGILYPCINGCFDRNGAELDGSKTSIGVQYRMSSLVKDVMGKLTPVVTQGNSVDPQILRVADHKSGWDSGNLTEAEKERPGTISVNGFFRIEGKNLCIVGEKEDVGVYFDAEDGSESIKLSSKDIVRNDASVIECIAPAEMAVGNYRIRIVTQYSKTKTYHAEPRVAVFNRPVVIN